MARQAAKGDQGQYDEGKGTKGEHDEGKGKQGRHDEGMAAGRDELHIDVK